VVWIDEQQASGESMVCVSFSFSIEYSHSRRLDVHFPLYCQQFSKTETKYGRLTADGHSDFFSFCTGRRNIASLHTVFTFRPRHDLLQYIVQLGRQVIDLQYRPVDTLELDFTLTSGVLLNDFVFAVVSKDELVTIKDHRWDLVRFFFFLRNEMDSQTRFFFTI